jgi:hypothetical protein
MRGYLPASDQVIKNGVQLEAGHDSVVRGWFTQHITHPIAQRITGVHGAEEVSLQGNVIPLHTGVILHAASFNRLVEQRALCGEDMLTAGFIEFARFQLTLDTLNISNAALPKHTTFAILKYRAVTQADRRLRKALELSGHDRMVQTVRGTGYRFSTRF